MPSASSTSARLNLSPTILTMPGDAAILSGLVTSRWMLRAASAPERFFAVGFARFVSERSTPRRTKPLSPQEEPSEGFGVSLPSDLARFLAIVNHTPLGGFTPTRSLPRWPTWLRQALSPGVSRLRLDALLGGAIPFGTLDGHALVYFVADAPAQRLIGAISPSDETVQLLCRGVAELSVIVSLRDEGEDAEPPPFSIAEEEAASALFARGRARATLMLGTDPQLRSTVRTLARRPIDVPPPEGTYLGPRRKTRDREVPLAIGPLVEAFLREDDGALRDHLAAHAGSSDRCVREAASLFSSALETSPRTIVAQELSRRRTLALRALRTDRRVLRTTVSCSLETTRSVVRRIDSLPPNTESYGVLLEREEALSSLGFLGDKRILPELYARAEDKDAASVDMLAVLRPPGFTETLMRLLADPHGRAHAFETAVVRALARERTREAATLLRQRLDESPMNNWREGLERGALVRELVLALGEFGDEASAPKLLALLESTSHEYRAVLPVAAYALGQLRTVEALAPLERLLFSPKQPVTCEPIWALGAIGRAHPEVAKSVAAILERLVGLEAGAEATRITALYKVSPNKSAPKPAELRRAIERALWEPAFRQEETSRRRGWALRSIEELAELSASHRIEASSLFFGFEAIRYFVTRDDPRIRHAAHRAFTAWGLPVPTVRAYYAEGLDALEQTGGTDALIEAVRDPLGIFRHNVATRLAERNEPKSVRPLAEAMARVFAEPPTSTYEYDDAPPHLVAFVRALSRMNQPETNDVLLEGLRSDHHQVRAVIAEHAPLDPCFLPELTAMLTDPRSFLRSRAEKTLMSRGELPAPIEPTTTEVMFVARTIGGGTVG
jgi:HEAT repeat protein